MAGGFISPTPDFQQTVLSKHPYAEFLGRMQKPGRYLGGEEQAIIKPNWDDLACRFVLAFPDLYEIGMSHLGTRILYDLINKHEDLCCERAFSPWADLEEKLRETKLPLISLETNRPLSDFDVVGFSLQYELCYSNVLLNLDLGGVPLRASQRGDQDPIVVAGGPTATHPEPLAPFIDIFLVGEAEDVLPALLRQIGVNRSKGMTRFEVLKAACKTPGVYVPEFYEVAEDERSGFMAVSGRSEAGIEAGAPERIERTWVRDLADYPFPTRFPLPYAEAIFDRASVEITRGCTEGCRFCQAGMIYRPVRERTPDDIVKAVVDGIDEAGFSETSLTALSTADVSCIDPLIKRLVPELAKRKVKLGIASLRAYGLGEDMLDNIKKVGIDGLTFAPEAGTQRMRDVINKNVSEQDILDSAERIFSRGYNRMKMYFIMGLPTETEEDVAGIVQTAVRVRDLAKSLHLDRMPNVTASVSQHVPKPHTPFQWAAMDSMEDLHTKANLLWQMAKREKVAIKTHDVKTSWLECLFARGDRRMGDVLEKAYRGGARFDGWREAFKFDVWLDALEACEIDPTLFTQAIPLDAKLPWSHIDIGLEDGFLASEYRKSVKGRLSPPCGKPFGAQVHHRTVEAAIAEKKRLVCYDCGVACDLTDMRGERLVALRTLSKQIRPAEPDEEGAFEGDEPPAASSEFVPLERLQGRLSKSNLRDDHAFKENAEAAHSKMRIFFSKTGTLQFLGHLDVARLIPRMMRRAGLEMSFSRGFKPQPRMSFGPALALGMSAMEEVVEIDMILDQSREDLADMLSPRERKAIAADIEERLRKVVPSGMKIVGVTSVAPSEVKLGSLVAGADYCVHLSPEQTQTAQQRFGGVLDAEVIEVVREKKRKRAPKGKRRKTSNPPPPSEPPALNIRPFLDCAELDAESGVLSFRLLNADGGRSARPREIIEAFVGEIVAEHVVCRQRLLARDEETSSGVVGLLGMVPRYRESISRPMEAL